MVLIKMLNLDGVNNQITTIKNDLDTVCFHTKRDRALNPKYKQLLNKSLLGVEKLIKKKNYTSITHSSLIRPIVLLSSLSKKLMKTQNRVRKYTTARTAKVFQKRVMMSILPHVEEKISEIDLQLQRQQRLPVKYGQMLDQEIQKIEKKLEPTHPKIVDREVFHLILDRAPSTEKIEFKDLEGNDAPYPFKSYLQIFKNYLTQNPSKKGQVILSRLDQSFRLACKMNFVEDVFRNKKAKKGDQIDYYKKLSSIEDLLPDLDNPNKAFSEDQKKALEKFYQEVTASKDNDKKLSLDLFLHDISWDILKLIQQLKPGDFCFIPLGIHDHMVIIKIRRHPFENTYTYSIFNTGHGREHHAKQIVKKTKYVKPLSFKNLSLEAMSYEFWFGILKIFVMPNRTMEEFYQFHQEHLVEKGEGILDKRLGDWYILQLRGTCSYRALEIAIFTELNTKERKALEREIGQHVVEKQKKVVEYRELQFKRKKVRIGPQHACANKKRPSPLEQSQAILELAQGFAQSVKKRKIEPVVTEQPVQDDDEHDAQEEVGTGLFVNFLSNIFRI